MVTQHHNFSTMKQATIKITGKVQGVFYRAHAQKKAEALGLTGYARNLPDGSVEVVVQGDEAAIKSFVEWCRQGSPSAKVENVEVKYDKIPKVYEGFSVY